eukprot:3921798-Prymnesium_polylepis.1
MLTPTDWEVRPTWRCANPNFLCPAGRPSSASSVLSRWPPLRRPWPPPLLHVWPCSLMARPPPPTFRIWQVASTQSDGSSGGGARFMPPRPPAEVEPYTNCRDCSKRVEASCWLCGQHTCATAGCARCGDEYALPVEFEAAGSGLGYICGACLLVCPSGAWPPRGSS